MKLLSTLLSLVACEFSQDEVDMARKFLHRQFHGNSPSTGMFDDLVEKMLERTLAESANLHKLEDWKETTTMLNGDPRGDVIRTTYLSPAFELESGGAQFTLNPLYHVPTPKGDYVIVNQTWDVVEGDDERSLPLSDTYNHHWLIGGLAENPLGLCEDDFFWGGGAEYRHMDYTIPDGYGLARINAKGECGGNLHFINTMDLVTHWDGMNDPKGDAAAARKVADECGFVPGRDPDYCKEWTDGFFSCCFTGSRFPVNNPENRTKYSYRLKGTFEYIKNFDTTIKFGQMQLLDVGGNLHQQDGELVDATAEWNTAANLNNKGVHQKCNETVCEMSNSFIVGDGSKFGYGLCSGDMFWSYMHMHAGMIGAKMEINGKVQCASNPQIGTDETMHPGNEKGYLVGIDECVDFNRDGQSVRLNQGDVIGLTAWYDVDATSRRYAPAPGGKHGGIMALFFSIMACDPGTWGEVYVCRDDKCVGVPSSKGNKMSHFKDLQSCSQSCGAGPAPVPTPPAPTPVPSPAPTPSPAGTCTVSKNMNNNGHNMFQQKNVKSTEECCAACTSTAGCVGFTFVHPRLLSKGQCWLKDSIDDLVSDDAVDSGSIDQAVTSIPESPVGYTYFNWRDCGSAERQADIVGFSPKKMLVGGKNKLKVSANFKQQLDSANFTIKLTSGALGASLFDFTGDACSPFETQKSLFNQISLTWTGVECPVVGQRDLEVDLWIDPVVPKEVAYTTTTLLMHTQSGEEVMCMEVATEGKAENHVVQVV